ncbi:hypothetical protein [Sphingobacterium sp. 1.A.4]|uniref:hypothetical protein n=1 Tax=Sphingobacterium sp. 1.A.4 TaxID=2044603 RepID=UPI000C0BF42C|nr:hypothetical protein [Sphingobacterium sp. 1.A.4]
MKSIITYTISVEKDAYGHGEDSTNIKSLIRNLQEDLRNEHSYHYIEYLDHRIEDYSFHPEYNHYIYSIYFKVE